VAAARDLNSDKLADLLVPDSANGNVNVLLNDSQTSGTDLAILSSSASPEPVGVGTTLTYLAGIQNEGPQNASSVTFTDTLPANVTLVSATASQGSCTQAGGTVTCNLGALADATDAQVTITVTPTAAGSITNNMHITGAETDSVSANNSASQTS